MQEETTLERRQRYQRTAQGRCHFEFFYFSNNARASASWSNDRALFFKGHAPFFLKSHSAQDPLGRPLFFPCRVFSLADAVCLVFSLADAMRFLCFGSEAQYPLGDLSGVFFLSFESCVAIMVVAMPLLRSLKQGEAGMKIRHYPLVTEF